MLSPIKIILLLAVVAGVFLIARMVRGAVKKGGNPVDTGYSNEKDEGADPTEMEKCPNCGTYVSALEDHRCKR